MAIDDKTIDEKLQCNFNIEAAKILALLSKKFDIYEYLSGQETLSYD